MKKFFAGCVAAIMGLLSVGCHNKIDESQIETGEGTTQSTEATKDTTAANDSVSTSTISSSDNDSTTTIEQTSDESQTETESTNTEPHDIVNLDLIPPEPPVTTVVINNEKDPAFDEEGNEIL